jgi:hypothetical protein
MRRPSRFTLLLIGSLLAVAFVVAPATASDNPFIGSWENNDGDGSHQHATFSNERGGRYSYRDDGAGPGACPMYEPLDLFEVDFTSHGSYWLVGSDTIQFSGPAYCHYRETGGRAEWPHGPFGGSFTYNADNDTLTSDAAAFNCWYRSGSDPSVCD